MFDIIWTFQSKIGGGSPAAVFPETHIPSTILAMSEVIYPPALYSKQFPIVQC